MKIRYRKNENYNVLSKKIVISKDGITNLKEEAEKMIRRFHESENNIIVDIIELNTTSLSCNPELGNEVLLQVGYAILEED